MCIVAYSPRGARVETAEETGVSGAALTDSPPLVIFPAPHAKLPSCTARPTQTLLIT